MKWILLWFAVSTTGGMTSGSAEFDSVKACEDGKAALAGVTGQISDELKDYGKRMVRATCVSSQSQAKG